MLKLDSAAKILNAEEADLFFQTCSLAEVDQDWKQPDRLSFILPLTETQKLSSRTGANSCLLMMHRSEFSIAWMILWNSAAGKLEIPSFRAVGGRLCWVSINPLLILTDSPQEDLSGALVICSLGKKEKTRK